LAFNALLTRRWGTDTRQKAGASQAGESFGFRLSEATSGLFANASIAWREACGPLHGRSFSAEQVTLGGVPPLMSKHERFMIARALARAFLSVWPDRARMQERAGLALGYPWTFLAELTDRVLAEHGALRRPPSRALLLSIAFDPALLEFPAEETDHEALANGRRLEPAAMFLVEPRMEAPVGWSLPSVVDEHGLSLLLGLSARELEQLAGHGRSDRRASSEALRNYSYTWRGKRLIEAPKRILKRTQRKIASLILEKIPIHEAAHGFRRGRSIVSHAAAHSGLRLVIRLDLAEFFPSITGGRVVALFRTAGYPEHIARVLGILTTNITPAFVLRGVESSRAMLFRSRHLPQGAPSSPLIANACAHALDRRLSGLARRFGLFYTRYADDLVFSGSLGASLDRFLAIAAMIAGDEGFRINHRKTRVMRAGGRQKITGVVVNRRPNIERSEYERLKAILHNAARFGLESQNREQHPDFAAFLRGKVSYVAMINPARGAKLRAILERI
jgi:RNA-directed DNA polymerase